jgi:hypothetical protein
MSNVAHILEDMEYLVPLISYLGANPYWWARSAPSLDRELSLDEGRVQQIFERHPMIFRKSRYIEESKAYCYALQMRYAQRRDGETEHPPQVSAFPVLSESEVIALIEFLVKVSTLETGVRSATRSAYVAVAAAILAALAAIAAALLKRCICNLTQCRAGGPSTLCYARHPRRLAVHQSVERPLCINFNVGYGSRV